VKTLPVNLSDLALALEDQGGNLNMEHLEPSLGEGISYAKLHGLITALAVGPVPTSKPDFLGIILKAGWEPAEDDQASFDRVNEC
jgi:hypothetical protein